MVSLEKDLPETFVPGKKNPQGSGVLMGTTKNVKWAARIGDFCCGTPTVAHGKVLLGGMIEKQGVLKCFDEATGKLLWQWIKPCRADLQADAMNFRHFPKTLGVCSTPAVDGDRVFFVDQNCVVACLDIHGRPPTAGADVGAAKEIWTFDMYTDKAVGSRPSDACNGSPLVDGDLLYVTTSNGVDRIIQVPIEEDAARRCFAPNAPTAANMLHGQWSSPSLGTVQGRKLVFLGGGGALLCLDANQTGNSANAGKLWTYQGLDRSLSTVSIADGLLYVADVGGRLHCLDAETGKLHWVYDSKSRVIASTMVADGNIYLPNEKHLHILAAGKTMKLLDEISLGAPSWSTPVVASGTLYITSKKYLWAVRK